MAAEITQAAAADDLAVAASPTNKAGTASVLHVVSARGNVYMDIPFPPTGSVVSTVLAALHKFVLQRPPVAGEVITLHYVGDDAPLRATTWVYPGQFLEFRRSTTGGTAAGSNSFYAGVGNGDGAGELEGFASTGDPDAASVPQFCGAESNGAVGGAGGACVSNVPVSAAAVAAAATASPVDVWVEAVVMDALVHVTALAKSVSCCTSRPLATVSKSWTMSISDAETLVQQHATPVGVVLASKLSPHARGGAGARVVARKPVTLGCNLCFDAAQVTAVRAALLCATQFVCDTFAAATAVPYVTVHCGFEALWPDAALAYLHTNAARVAGPVAWAAMSKQGTLTCGAAATAFVQHFFRLAPFVDPQHAQLRLLRGRIARQRALKRLEK